jgi:phosphoribosyl 1,2-cyclic phosphate phosphodiesterase
VIKKSKANEQSSVVGGAMELVFLGTGAGSGVPAFYCGCKGCREAFAEPRYRRTRCAIAVLGNKNFLFDAPPELASQLLREHIAKIDYFILTHAHPDHCPGMGDLEIYTRFYRRDVLPAVMSHETLAQLEGSFGSVNDWLSVILLEPGQALELFDLKLTALKVSHASGTLGFLIEYNGSRTAYIPDTGPLPPETKTRLEGIERLILDTTFWGENLYPNQHLSFEETVATAQELEVKELYLSHLSMHYTVPITNREIEQEIEKYNGRVNLAYDGLRLSLE